MEEYRKYNQNNNKVQNNSSYSNRSVEYYKTVEKRTISNEHIKILNNLLKNKFYSKVI